MSRSRARALAACLGLAIAVAGTPALADEEGSDATRGIEGATPSAVLARVEVLDAPRWVIHRLAPRETLTQVAARYGVKLESIRKWNPELPREPKKKEKIRIRTDRVPPPRHVVDHVVKPGDTWWSIAVAHGVDSRDLRAYNWRKNRTLVEGETLQVWVDPVVFSRVLAEQSAPPWGVRPGGIGVGSPNEGRLVNAVQLPESDLYHRHMPRSAWGTSNTIRSLVAALTSFRENNSYGGRIYVSAISQPRGGVLGGHKSHQSGRDVDIRLPLREEIPQGLAPRPSRRVDFLATYQLVRALIDTGEVVYVFLDYRMQKKMFRAAEAAGVPADELEDLTQWPRGSKASRGVVRHSPGHDDHIHVRFRCGPEETECVALVPEGRAGGGQDPDVPGGSSPPG